MYNTLYKKLEQSRSTWQTEEEVRKDWLKHLENELGISFHAERERNDARHNQVIIEFKNRGHFNGSTSSPAFKEAVYDRLEPYITERAESNGLPQADYIGIATDGVHVCFAHFKEGSITYGDLLPFSPAAISKVAEACKSAKRRAVNTSNLIEDFGHESTAGQALMTALSNELSRQLDASANNKVKMLYEEWRTLFGQVANFSEAQVDRIRKALPFSANLSSEHEIPGALFVVHTYNALVMKLLAAEIVSEYNLTSYSDFCEHAAALGDEEMVGLLRQDIERSNLFDLAGIEGFVEEAIFSWYVDQSLSPAGLERILGDIREVLVQLSLYRTDVLDGARSRDVLKSFYQNLVPETLRKSLGEFYTPDWLVDVTCDRVETDNWLDIRALDPTCGSGSFLLEIIRRKRSEGEDKRWGPGQMLDHLVENVWGFDLNPLAVQAARVNFLIAVADLVSACRGKHFELPILLADSVYSPAHDTTSDENTVTYHIGSTEANLEVVLPTELAFDRDRLETVFVTMEDGVTQDEEYEEVETHLKNQNVIPAQKEEEWRSALSSTYHQVLKLHRKNWNGIWFRIVKNFFWSATAGVFDVVIGNPPWVRWSSLPEAYRERIKATCESYEIFSDTPFHGGNELDISGMITYTVGDKWLKEDGELVFVITQSHFQSPSSQGFRSFKIDDDFYFIPERVDDLKALKPFPDAANKTAVMRLKKKRGTQPEYPVSYWVWDKSQGTSRNLPAGSTKSEILGRTVMSKMEANPVGDARSPWAIMSPGSFQQTSAIQGASGWVDGRKGVTTDLNAIYMVEILDENPKERLVEIRTRPEAGRTDVGKSRTFWVEPDLLYPLLKGAGDFERCHLDLRDELYIFVPNCGITKGELQQAAEKVASLPKTKRYFEYYEDILRDRSTWKARLSNSSFYTIYNVGDYTFAPYKVVWAEQSGTFEAAVASDSSMPILGERVYVPDHKLYYVDFQKENPAYYLCGLLTCRLVAEFIESHTISIQVSNIFKHLSLPPYDADESDHIQLAEKVKKAHGLSDETERETLVEEIDALAEKIIF